MNPGEVPPIPRFVAKERKHGPFWDRRWFPQIWDNELNEWSKAAYVGIGCGWEVAERIAESMNRGVEQ